jgi:hypothetical protein
MKKIYRLTFKTFMLVEADHELEAEKIGKKFLPEEVNNDLSELEDIELLNCVTQLLPEENYSLPWVSIDRQNEEQICVNTLLSKIK